ncbi:scaffoldin [Neocallimastix californiae]|uniref:Scaffoldin n=1 Tax=Neocallimastix californiae TaxID=1754190 RepID=A0A1Y1YAJ8_9FUNG|nr:scaffoldin [Neocallimastix californiae]|eukprot:ORX95051.1 scaffoldin [Neocallimastix californiae]
MLGWKYLRLLGLIFIANNLKVEAAGSTTLTALPVCTTPFDDDGTTVLTNKSCVKDGTDLGASYCILSDGSKLYESTASSCNDKTNDLTADAFYVYKCTATACNPVDDVSTLADTDSVLLYKKTTADGLAISNVEYYLDSTKNRLFSCTSGVCSLVTTPGYYKNDSTKSNEDQALLIKVASNKDATAISDAASGNAYLDGSSFASGKYKKVLECTEDSGNVVCANPSTQGKLYVNSGAESELNDALIDCSTTGECKTKTAVVGYYENGGSDDTKPLIKCEGTTCVASEAETNGGIYLDANTKEDETYTSLITCTSGTACSSASATTGNYVNVAGTNTDENTLITCTETGCTVGNGAAGDVYINSSTVDKTEKPIIKCEESSGCAASVASAGIYLDANTKNDDETYTNLITCSETTTCSSASTTTGNYVNVASSGTDGNSLITCTETGCTVGNGATGNVYINSSTVDKTEKPIIKCEESSGCATSVASAGIYLDANTKNDDETYTNLITCSETTTCSSASTTTGNYVNVASSGTDGNSLITCTETGCTVGNGATGNVYINSSTVDKTEKPIIKCEESSGCAASVASAGIYLDANTKNEETYTNLITCTNATTCSSASTTTGNYVNVAGTNTDENTLITCTETGCTVGNGATGNVYINSSTVDKTEKPIIKCEESSGCAASVASAGIYLDANTKNEETYTNLITCTNATTCSSASTTTGNYVNVAGTNTDENTLITCTETGCTVGNGEVGNVYINSSTVDKTSNPIIICDENNGCAASEAAENGGIYLDANTKNEETYTNLITCTNATTCSSASTTTGNYVNVAGTNTDENTLITCTEEGCTVGNGEVGNVYINSSTVDKADKPIIKCDDTNGCAASEAAENGGIYLDANTKNEETYTNLITCTNATTCSSAFTTTGNYVNVAGTNENGNTLITCTETGCTVGNGEDGDYYINSGVDKDNKQLIICNSGCVAEVVSTEGIYLDANTKDDDAESPKYEKLILCKGPEDSIVCNSVLSNATTDKYQYYLNTSDLADETGAPLTKDLIKCSKEDDKVKCEAADGEAGKVYINSFDPSSVIYCVEGEKCAVKPSTPEENKPQFYVNGGDVVEGLSYDIIKCSLKKNKSEDEGTVTCDVANGKEGDVYLNGNFVTGEGEEIGGDTENQLILCSANECVSTQVTLSEEAPVEGEAQQELKKRQDDLQETEQEAGQSSGQESAAPSPKYYLNSGNEGKDKFAAALIQCVNGDDDVVTCDLYKADQYEVYVNGNTIDNEKVPLIKCSKNACSKVASAATENSKEYYINAGDTEDSPLTYDIIECAIDGEKVVCAALEEINEGVYVNTNYSDSGDNKQLIQCSSDNGCVGMATADKGVEYFVNAESTDLNNAIIFCSNKKCEKQTPADINIYYVGKDNDNVNGLIECVETTEAETTNEDATKNQDEAIPPEKKRATESTTKKCTLKSAFTSQGYYLNSGYNKSVNQIIICDSTDGCNTVKVDLGYYVNAGNADKPIIKCEKEGSECIEEASKSCPDPAKAVPGNYCYEDSQLKFFTVNNSTAIAASKSDDTYAFATIPSNGFPGIKSETGSLFKISRYFINRFYQSGVIMIDKNGKLVDSLGGDTSDISLYDCNDSTKVCTERPGCTSNTYMFDSENRKAVFCNDGNLEYAIFTGYVVDGNRVTSGTKHPYIIQCENGENCTSFKPKSSTYYENSGYDSTTNSLIQCNNSNCMTVAADVGYYVAHSHIDNNGVIKCTTATNCSYSQVKNKVKYVNAGFDKRNNAIIECKGGKCNVAKAKSGYYLTHTSTLLIQCTSPTSCSEFTPTVNYYDNADSSESSNTIINCIQNSNVVTCSSEATNNGFYMSSLSNVLIRCKAGHKCKTITVKNGIFRGALKGLTSSKRSDNVQNVHERDADDDLEEDGKMVNLRDNSDDAYGIIRCVAGKCAALSASELAAISMCEFNNNKCYITLEYAMTKSATTSIAAGNICTNSDRSVFYFATDTVVVKPNVISGVTSTYVYTTTNSNCLEVNDSYNDMYFTVGSNIYTLDQGSVLQFYETGYYFLNVAKNTLVSGNEIDAYNDENVKLYRCNGSSCSIIDKPDANTYYADVNKRILKYNVNNDVFTFAYEKDIICIFANNKCTPNADLKNQEFCITYKGEIVLATIDIKNRETGECYRAGTINNYIYGYSQHLYHMNQFSAEMVDQTGFYIISLSTNTTVVSKNYKNKNNSIVVYGCNLSSCRVYEPDEDTYYYDAQARNILRYKDGVWSSPSTSGYAYIAINPTNTYVYKFAKKGDEIIIQGKANYGYYYTIDDEMYHCDQEDGECKPIDETGYYFTNAGEVFSCVHDSEGLEATECVKQNCVSGQYYYIDDAYYRCEVSSLLVPVVSRYCSYDDNVVVNFPLALTEEFPDKIKLAVDDIQKNNNSTAVVTRHGKNYLEAVSGIFTNCTYNVEETRSTFDLVCVNNYVRIDDETDEVKICNVDQLGYVECIEDEENPEKCSFNLMKNYN